MLAVFGTALMLALGGGSWGFLSLPIKDRTPILTLVFLTFAGLGGYLAARLLAFEKLRCDLVRGGSPVEGVVVERRLGRGPWAHFTIWYSAEGSEWRIEASGDESLADIGDVLTVLHEPSNPACALVYRFSGCVAVPVGTNAGGAGIQSAFHSSI